MRARHRHFNPRFVGAQLVLDSRYIVQSDDTVVSSWSDRSGNGNDATQNTALNQPKFRTGVRGGNGVVRFDGSNDFLSIADAGSLDTSGYLCLFVGYVMRQSSSVGTLVAKRRNALAGTYNYALYSISLTTYCTWGESSPVADNFKVLSGAESTNTPYVFNYSYKKGTFTAHRNGASQSISSSGGSDNVDISPNSAPVQIGNGPTSGSPNQWPSESDISFVYFLKDEINASVRRRIEHASAYSFKIACS